MWYVCCEKQAHTHTQKLSQKHAHRYTFTASWIHRPYGARPPDTVLMGARVEAQQTLSRLGWCSFLWVDSRTKRRLTDSCVAYINTTKGLQNSHCPYVNAWRDSKGGCGRAKLYSLCVCDVCDGYDRRRSYVVHLLVYDQDLSSNNYPSSNVMFATTQIYSPRRNYSITYFQMLFDLRTKWWLLYALNLLNNVFSKFDIDVYKSLCLCFCSTCTGIVRLLTL